MRKGLIFLVVFSFAVITLQAQKMNDVVQEKSIILKLAPFKLIGFESNASFSVERKFESPFGIQLQTDLLLGKVNNNNGDRQNYRASGYRIIPEARYYYGNYDMTLGYLGVNLMYKKTNISFDEFKTVTDGSGQSYLTLTAFDVKKHVVAPNYIMGWLFYLGKEKRLVIDVNAGIGYRSKRIESSLPIVSTGNWTIDEYSSGDAIGIACNLKLGYCLHR